MGPNIPQQQKGRCEGQKELDQQAVIYGLQGSDTAYHHSPALEQSKQNGCRSQQQRAPVLLKNQAHGFQLSFQIPLGTVKRTVFHHAYTSISLISGVSPPLLIDSAG